MKQTKGTSLSQPVGGSGYSREKIYGDKGQDTERIHPYIPTYILSELQKIVGRENTPFDTGHDFVRDALVHSIVWWNAQDGETDEGTMFKHRAVAQNAVAAQKMRESTAEFYEQALRGAQQDQARWNDLEEQAQEAIVALEAYSDIARRIEIAIVSTRPR